MTPSPPGTAVPRLYYWLGAAVAGLGIVQLLADNASAGSPVLLLTAVVCGAAVALLPRALLWATLGVCVSVTAMVVAIEVPLFASFLATMVTAFTLARYAGRRTAILGFTALVLTVVVVAVPELRATGEGVFGIVYPVVYFGGSATLGWLTRQRANHIQTLKDIAAALERDRHQQAELAAVAERERLAREMHDVISHGVSLMVVQAEAASEVLATRPDAAADALEAIADTGRSAMNDLHRMLGLLHGSATDLGELSRRVRAAGVDVRLEVDTSWSTLAEPVRLALYRVAQEAVTNVLRHAKGAKEVSIRFANSVDTLTLEVRDDGIGANGAGEGLGSGIQGLRERLAALGGVLDAGPIASGGFEVRATIPQGAS